MRISELARLPGESEVHWTAELGRLELEVSGRWWAVNELDNNEYVVAEVTTRVGGTVRQCDDDAAVVDWILSELAK